MGLGIHSGNTKSTALKTEFKIASVERCMRWYKRFHNSCKFTFHFTGLLRNTFNYSDYTDFMRGQLTKGQNWKQSRRLCQNSSEGDLESIEEENEQILVESIIKNLTAVKYFARARASFPFHYIYHEFHQRCNTSVSANQSSTLKLALWVVKFHFTSVVVECSERWWAMKTMLRKQVYYPMRNIVALTFIISGCSGELRMC